MTWLDKTDFTGSPMTKNASSDPTIIEATGYIFKKISICHSGTAVAQDSLTGPFPLLQVLRGSPTSEIIRILVKC